MGIPKYAECTRLNIVDAKLEFIHSLKTNNGFIITARDNIIKKKPKSIKTDDGIFSNRFGTTWGDDQAFSEKYRCDCGNIKGTFNSEKLCKECNTKVTFKDDNLNMTGWLVMEDNYILHPSMYIFIKRYMGKEYLDEIIKGPTIDKNGNITYEYKEDNPYNQIGLTGLRKKFDEIMDYFYKKQKDDLYDIIYEHKDKIFIRHIPVFTYKLRPQKIDGDDIFKDKINDDYQLLQFNVLALNGIKRRTILNNETTLYNIQEKYNEICGDKILKNIYNNRKTGLVRKNLLGARMNYSSRNVIVSLVDHCRSNEVHLPYKTALELFKPMIITTLKKVDNMSHEEAVNLVNLGRYRFDNRIYSAMNFLIKYSKKGLRLLINRNPTLADGSIMCVKVTKIKPDFDDLTLAISLRVLNLFNADFDGDVMNLIAIMDNKTKEDKIRVFDPKYTQYISPNNGRFNNRVNLTKSEIIILSNL